jgi:hypothetical protein
MIIYKKITWEEILPIWKEHLPNMSLEQTSAMCLLLEHHSNKPRYDLKNMEFTPTFWGAFDKDKLVFLSPIKLERENTGRCILKAG